MTVNEIIALFQTYNGEDRAVILVNGTLVDITMVMLETPKVVELFYKQTIEQGVVILCPAANDSLDPKQTTSSEILLSKCKEYKKKAIRKKP
jgi:hypothetical protein